MNKAMSYKEASRKLHDLVDQLDNDDIKLEDLAEKIKEAKTLIEFCTDKLRTIEDSVKSATEESGQ
jgi:exodeoxyribonuclease VII small subunit